MTLQWILGWWNLIFMAPFAVALLYLGVYTLTGVGIGDADADAHGDFDPDADADVDADVDAEAHFDADSDAHIDADPDGDADADHDAHGEGNPSSGHSSFHMMALSWLGVGRVPLTLIVIVLLLTWGSAGFVASALLRPREGWEAARLSLPVALVVSVFITRAVVLFMGRFVPLNETYAVRRGELVGCVGEAIYGINESFGMAMVRDGRGDLHQVTCRVGAGIEPVEKGAKVKLVAYGPRDRTFFVRRADV
jgi:hypothetical protein